MKKWLKRLGWIALAVLALSALCAVLGPAGLAVWGFYVLLFFKWRVWFKRLLWAGLAFVGLLFFIWVACCQTEEPDNRPPILDPTHALRKIVQSSTSPPYPNATDQTRRAQTEVQICVCCAPYWLADSHCTIQNNRPSNRRRGIRLFSAPNQVAGHCVPRR